MTLFQVSCIVYYTDAVGGGTREVLDEATRLEWTYLFYKPWATADRREDYAPGDRWFRKIQAAPGQVL